MRKRIFILSITLLLLSTTFFCGSYQVFAADAEQQPPQEQNVVDPYLEEIIACMSPTDNISVLVYLRGDPDINRQIQAIWQGQPDDEMHTIKDNLMQQLRNASAEMYPFEQQLLAGDPDAIERYKEIEAKYGITDESTRAAVQRLTELHDAKVHQIAALEEQAYSDLHERVRKIIEQLPDTTVTSSNFALNSLGVQTIVHNIQILATVPEVIKIAYNSIGVPAISQYYGIQLLSPTSGSRGWLINEISFSWSPYKETTKYKFVLAKDVSMTEAVKQAEVAATSYKYDGTLDYGTDYFWRVMALEPAPSDWSATFSFHTIASPPPSGTATRSFSWGFITILGVVIVSAGAVGLTVWFFAVRGRRAI